MIVVVPEAHALPPEDVTGTDHALYLAKNQQTVDEELFHDIIPFIITHYNVSDQPEERAIAGYRWGGFKRLKPVLCTWAIFVGWVGSVLDFVPRHSPRSSKTRYLIEKKSINACSFSTSFAAMMIKPSTQPRVSTLGNIE